VPKTPVETATIRRITLALVPFLMLCYLVSFIDRVNVGFAALHMNKDVGLTGSMFGFGGGVFFLSYFLFEVPSNLAMQRFGARRWLARIMITWGLVSACSALVVGPWSFYAVRFLLGAAEAGFFPGVILYLTYWFPAEYRGRMVSLFYVAVPLSSFVGSPVSAALLGTEGMLGLHGWQWLFVLEAVPAVLLGFITLAVLPDRPSDATWLDGEQRGWLTRRLAEDAARPATVTDRQTWRVLFHPSVLLLALVYAGSSAASNGLALWQPQMLKAFGLTDMQTGLMNSVPFAFASVVMVWWGYRSDRLRERVWSTALPLAVSAGALALCLLSPPLLPTVALLGLALTGTYAFKGPFWALSTEMLGPVAAAAGLAQVNAIGNLAGFGGTYLIGAIRDATGSYQLALLPLVALEAIGCVVLIVMAARRTAVAEPSGVA
jgi:ACS family tartrate transporter-like MFS transporter